jgi:hypothetical protein
MAKTLSAVVLNRTIEAGEALGEAVLIGFREGSRLGLSAARHARRHSYRRRLS